MIPCSIDTLQLVRCFQKLRSDPWLPSGMAAVGNKVELSLGPHLMQLPGRRGRADDVVAPLHDRSRDVTDLVNVALLKQLPVFQPAGVDKVVRLDARKCEGPLRNDFLLATCSRASISPRDLPCHPLHARWRQGQHKAST